MTRSCAYAACGKPLVQRPSELRRNFLRRETCDLSCGAALGHQRAKEAGHSHGTKRPFPEWEPPWPQITGEVIADFSGHEVVTNDGGARRIDRPLIRSGCGCAAGYCAEGMP